MLVGAVVLAMAPSPEAVAQSCTAGHVTLVAPYCGTYSIADLGAVPGVPTYYGATDVPVPGDPNFIIIGGAADSAVGALIRSA